jgi:hypothetical protein
MSKFKPGDKVRNRRGDIITIVNSENIIDILRYPVIGVYKDCELMSFTEGGEFNTSDVCTPFDLMEIVNDEGSANSKSEGYSVKDTRIDSNVKGVGCMPEEIDKGVEEFVHRNYNVPQSKYVRATTVRIVTFKDGESQVSAAVCRLGDTPNATVAKKLCRSRKGIHGYNTPLSDRRVVANVGSRLLFEQCIHVINETKGQTLDTISINVKVPAGLTDRNISMIMNSDDVTGLSRLLKEAKYITLTLNGKDL